VIALPGTAFANQDGLTVVDPHGGFARPEVALPIASHLGVA
jgi:hypothetical protein